ncbi:MAG: hypothetical protein CR997_00735 [Acidobacteria bacterium]|nr:MAG: hypothetical protein CR997_00735 [Acidobacteriota bacterium]
MSELLIGTSGYYYKDWVGSFYPQGTREYLAYYQREFHFTELNFSYYRMPQASALEKMAAQTSETFQFAIKATRNMTHETSPQTQGEVQTFVENIQPLVDSGKLAAVLLQFPFSFHYTVASRKHLAKLCQAMRDLPLAVEFRNREWQRQSVYDGLRQLHVCFANVDLPALPGLPTVEKQTTAKLAYIRFHGRNKANWWQGDNASRYDYHYNERELGEWVPYIQALRNQSKKVILAFNNHWNAQAIQNARMMIDLLNIDNRNGSPVT